MPPAVIVLVVVAVLVLVVVGAYYSWKAEQERKRQLAALASNLGLEFDPGQDHRHDDEYRHFEIFRQGHGRVAFNTLHGEMEIGKRRCWVKTGDFRYKVTTSNGKSRSTSTYTLSYLIVELPYRGMPDLLIRPEGMFDKLAGAFGFDDIDFESAEFSKKFYVKSSDKRFAYDVIHPRMMEFLLRTKPPTIDIEHGRLLLAQDRRRWKPDYFKTAIRYADQFFDLWPEHLLQDLDATHA